MSRATNVRDTCSSCPTYTPLPIVQPHLGRTWSTPIVKHDADNANVVSFSKYGRVALELLVSDDDVTLVLWLNEARLAHKHRCPSGTSRRSVYTHR